MNTDTLKIDGVTHYSSFYRFANVDVHHINKHMDLEVTPAVQDYLSLCDNGWPDGLHQLKEIEHELDKSILTPNIRRSTSIYSQDFGDEYDIHRILSGSMSPWRVKKKHRVQRAPLTIYINVDHNGFVRGKAKFWPVAVALVLCKYLVSIGHPLKIIGLLSVKLAASSKYELVEHEFEILFKDFIHPFNLNTLALCGHDLFQRYHGFKAFASLDKKLALGLGRARFIERRGDDVISISNVSSKANAIAELQVKMKGFKNDCAS